MPAGWVLATAVAPFGSVILGRVMPAPVLPHRLDAQPTELTSVHLVTLGCARNEVDSEELAARLEDGGFRLVDDPAEADAVMVNTCGFVEAAKKDSVDTLLAAADLKSAGRTQAVVAVGCLAERYGAELAESLPEADAVLGFDDYADVADRLQSHPGRRTHTSPRPPRPTHPAAAGPADRRRPRRRPRSRATPRLPGSAPASGPRAVRRRLDGGPSAPLKIASGCDRRCTFCAIPAFRGAYVSRGAGRDRGRGPLAGRRRASGRCSWSARTPRPTARTSATSGCWSSCWPSSRRSTGWTGSGCPTCSPPRCGPSLVELPSPAPPKVVPYFDLSFQHAAPAVLRRMRRFGDPDSFLGLIESIRAAAPAAGIRSNVICGFPGETEDDLADAERLPDRRRAGRDRGVRLLRRGRHRGRRPWTVSLPPTRSSSAGRSWPTWPTSWSASGPRTGSGRPCEVLVEEIEPSRRRAGRPSGSGGRRLRPAARPAPGPDRRPGRRRGRRRATAWIWSPRSPRGHDRAARAGSAGAPAISPSEKHPVAPVPEPETTPWNVPNALTAFRIVLVPVFAWMLLSHPDEPWWRVLHGRALHRGHPDRHASTATWPASTTSSPGSASWPTRSPTRP